MSIRIARVYDEPSAAEDGYRVLVDRLWPRGMRKDRLRLDEWAKDVAPSTELRRAWHSGQIDGDEFAARYAAELDGNPSVAALARRAEAGTVTLLVATRDVAHSHAHVLVRALGQEDPHGPGRTSEQS